MDDGKCEENVDDVYQEEDENENEKTDQKELPVNLTDNYKFENISNLSDI